ncbi:hypothetical protein Taro_045763 [Colocasia esculenta]|uniref:Uncharacterized protein n=1 Tax=Colocasia esculenta TaxID=4460 RepID=A0A843X0W2_COLES|nr:hypothetical protein [Colocasia esculenta]
MTPASPTWGERQLLPLEESSGRGGATGSHRLLPMELVDGTWWRFNESTPGNLSFLESTPAFQGGRPQFKKACSTVSKESTLAFAGVDPGKLQFSGVDPSPPKESTPFFIVLGELGTASTSCVLSFPKDSQILIKKILRSWDFRGPSQGCLGTVGREFGSRAPTGSLSVNVMGLNIAF